MNKKHFDALGHTIYNGLELSEIIIDTKSLYLLKQYRLGRLIVYPFIEIRIFPNHPESGEIRLYGCGSDVARPVEFNPMQLSKMRKFYGRALAAGWTVEKTAAFVAFRRGARVTLFGGCYGG